MAGSLETGFKLDRFWHWLRGEMDRSKEPDLAALVQALSVGRVPYAVIGGVALQIHQREPRTTIDIDIAVVDRGALPREVLRAAGFSESGRHAHSDNWIGPAGTPIQFTDDPALRGAVDRAMEVTIGALSLRVIQPADLLHEKLRSGSDSARRRSKRLQDLADAQALLEQDPSLLSQLTPEEKILLANLPD